VVGKETVVGSEVVEAPAAAAAVGMAVFLVAAAASSL